MARNPARNACNCIYFHIQEMPVNVLFCMLAIGMYAFIVLGGGGGGGGALDVLKTCG